MAAARAMAKPVRLTRCIWVVYTRLRDDPRSQWDSGWRYPLKKDAEDAEVFFRRGGYRTKMRAERWGKPQ